MKRFLLIFVFAHVFQSGISQKTITEEEFMFLDNSTWTGNLMYINYSDGKEVNIPTELQIDINASTLIMKTTYPYEPKANSKSRIKLDIKNNLFGDEKIIEIGKEEDILKMRTQFKGKDNNKPATMTKTYSLSPSRLQITKEVTYSESGESLIRNTYTYTKN